MTDNHCYSEMYATSERYPPFITVLDGQQLDKAA